MGGVNEPSSPRLVNDELFREYELLRITFGFKENFTKEETIYLLNSFIAKSTQRAKPHPNSISKKSNKQPISLANIQIKITNPVNECASYLDPRLHDFFVLSERIFHLFDVQKINHCSALNFVNIIGILYKGTAEEQLLLASKFIFDREPTIDYQNFIHFVECCGDYFVQIFDYFDKNAFVTNQTIEAQKLFANVENVEFQYFYRHFKLTSPFIFALRTLQYIIKPIIISMKNSLTATATPNLSIFHCQVAQSFFPYYNNECGPIALPRFLEQIFAFIRNNNLLNTAGIFRTCPLHDHENAYTTKLESGKTIEEIILENEEGLTNKKLCILIAALITRYCGRFEDDIFPIHLLNLDTVDQKVDYVVNLFDSLPVYNRYFLGSLLKFLSEVSKAQLESFGVGKGMTAKPLAVVFAICLCKSLNDPESIKNLVNCIELMIENSYLFVFE